MTRHAHAKHATPAQPIAAPAPAPAPAPDLDSIGLVSEAQLQTYVEKGGGGGTSCEAVHSMISNAILALMVPSSNYQRLDEKIKAERGQEEEIVAGMKDGESSNELGGLRGEIGRLTHLRDSFVGPAVEAATPWLEALPAHLSMLEGNILGERKNMPGIVDDFGNMVSSMHMLAGLVLRFGPHFAASNIGVIVFDAQRTIEKLRKPIHEWEVAAQMAP